MSAMIRRYSGSGEDSRTGIPTSWRPGMTRENTSLTASQTCSGPRWTVIAYIAPTPVGAPTDPSDDGLQGYRTAVPFTAGLFHRIADGR